MGQEDPGEPIELRGRLYHDGVDSLGRPVVVLNADAVAANVSRQWACQYMLHRLEPIVSQACPLHSLQQLGARPSGELNGELACLVCHAWLVRAGRSHARCPELGA